MRDIAKNIRDLRQSKSMTQDTLAEKLYVTRQTVSNYETGRTRPDVEMVIRIAEILETDANTILYGIPAPPERKAEIKKLFFAAATLLVLLPLYGWLGDITEWYRSYKYLAWPKFLLSTFMTPVVFLLLGWTLMQTLGTFTKLSPLFGNASRWVRLSVCGFTALYLAILIPIVLGIWFPWHVPVFWQKIALALLGALPNQLQWLDRSILFFLSGILLWLFRLPCEKS